MNEVIFHAVNRHLSETIARASSTRTRQTQPNSHGHRHTPELSAMLLWNYCNCLLWNYYNPNPNPNPKFTSGYS